MSLTFGEKIKEARKQKNLTQKQLADLIGAAHNSISDWENNKNKPDPDTIELLCGALKITPNYLLASTEDDFSPKEKLLIKKYRLISTRSPDGAVVVDTVLDREYAIAEKLREQKEQLEKVQKMDMEVAEEIVPFRIISYHQKLASAGNGQVVFDDGAVDRIQIPDIKKYKRVSYAIGVNGKSMEPLYHDGDILLIEPTCQVEIGEIGIFIVDGEAFVKKLGNGELISLNKGHKNITLTEYSNCMGRVVDKLKND